MLTSRRGGGAEGRAVGKGEPGRLRRQESCIGSGLQGEVRDAVGVAGQGGLHGRLRDQSLPWHLPGCRAAVGWLLGSSNVTQCPNSLAQQGLVLGQ